MRAAATMSVAPASPRATGFMWSTLPSTRITTQATETRPRTTNRGARSTNGDRGGALRVERSQTEPDRASMAAGHVRSSGVPTR